MEDLQTWRVTKYKYFTASILTLISVPSAPNRLIFNTFVETDRHHRDWSPPKPTSPSSGSVVAEADVWRSDTKGGSEGPAALRLDCEQTGGRTRDTAAQRGEKNSSDAEETDGASQQDVSSPWPCLKETSEILGSDKMFIIFCIFISPEVGKIEV